MKSMHFKALPVGHQNRQISRDFLQQILKESLLPFGVLIAKIMDFKEID